MRHLTSIALAASLPLFGMTPAFAQSLEGKHVAFRAGGIPMVVYVSKERAFVYGYNAGGLIVELAKGSASRTKREKNGNTFVETATVSINGGAMRVQWHGFGEMKRDKNCPEKVVGSDMNIVFDVEVSGASCTASGSKRHISRMGLCPSAIAFLRSRGIDHKDVTDATVPLPMKTCVVRSGPPSKNPLNSVPK